MGLYNFQTIHLPYCLKKMSDGSYVVLNREYKPVGFKTSKHVKYEDYPVSVKFRITKKTASSLSHNGSDGTDMIFLYDDGCVPTRSKANMNAYLEKIEKLAKLKAL